MKTILSSFFALALLFVLQSSASAQRYYVYDGDTFSVLLTADNANTRITNVQFSANNQWHDFRIIDFTNLEDTGEGGFLYTVLDGVGKEYTVDYYRSYDYIIVREVVGSGEWTLYRRDE
jgi:hypothetical protein